MTDLTLAEAIQEFTLSLEQAGRAPKTLRWYGDILARYQAAAGELTRSAIVRYLAARRHDVSLSTVAGEYRALRRFCGWLHSKNLIDHNPISQVDPTRAPETVPRVATVQTVLALAAAADRQRDRALVLVLADTGARLSEFLAITMDNLRVAHRDGIDVGEAWVIGKGGRRRRLLIGPAAMTELAAWIADRPAGAGSVIWWSDHGGSLTPDGVRSILRRLSKRAGLREAINPHAFRHGCAVDALVNGADVRTVQLMLGHAQLSTTARYLHLADTVVDHVHDQISQARFGEEAHLPPIPRAQDRPSDS